MIVRWGASREKRNHANENTSKQPAVTKRGFFSQEKQQKNKTCLVHRSLIVQSNRQNYYTKRNRGNQAITF